LHYNISLFEVKEVHPVTGIQHSCPDI